MFLDWKNQYCQNEYITQGNLQVQCNYYQITNDIFHRTIMILFFFFIETQNPIAFVNGQSNPKKEKWIWINQHP